MTFQDNFPTQFEFEIDRLSLKRFYRVTGFATSVIFPLLIASMISSTVVSDFMRTHASASWDYKLGMGSIIFFSGMGIGLLVGLTIYFAYFHRAAELHAQNLRLLVEGPYLRLIQGAYVVTDRRFHFRDIHTYSTIEGPMLRRFGIKAMTFCNDQRQASFFRIDGLMNADQVRDMLCEIDAARTPIASHA